MHNDILLLHIASLENIKYTQTHLQKLVNYTQTESDHIIHTYFQFHFIVAIEFAAYKFKNLSLGQRRCK